MTYKQTKLLSFLIVLCVCPLLSYIFLNDNIKNNPVLLLEKLIPIIFINLLISLLILVFFWKIYKTRYLKSLLNNLSLTDKDIKTIWMLSRRYSYSKDMDINVLESKTKVLVEFSSDKLKHCKIKDIKNIAIACICINYSLLWKSRSKGKNKEIISIFNQHYDYIKLVDHFKDVF